MEAPNNIFANVRDILMVVGALGVALIAFVSQIITYFGLAAPVTP